jgi:glycosyltransferase involved in cell wall biosynthesis
MMAPAGPGLSLVVPVYNEEALLAAAVQEIMAGLPGLGVGFEVILVENGSTDRSPEIVDMLARTDGRILGVHLPAANYGQALRHGFLAAHGDLMANFSIDWVDFAFLEAAMARVPEFDLVLATKGAPDQADQRPWLRRAGGAAFHGLVRVLFGVPISDTHGIKLMRRERVDGLVERCRYDAEVFDTELVVRACRAGLRICEIPVRVGEKRPSRVRVIKRAWLGLAQLVRLRFALWKEMLGT